MFEPIRAAAGSMRRFFPIAMTILLTTGWMAFSVPLRPFYVPVSTLYILACAMVIGSAIEGPLLSYRAHLVPGYQSAHAKLGIGFLGLLSAIAILARPPHVSALLLGSLLWFCMLAAFVWVYFFRPVTILWLAALVLLKADYGRRGGGFLLNDWQTETTALALIADAVLTFIVVREFFATHDRRKPQQSPSAPSGQATEGGTIAEWLTGTDRSLDAMNEVIPRSFLSQVRHFGFGTAAGTRRVDRLGLLFVVIILVLRLGLDISGPLVSSFPSIFPVMLAGFAVPGSRLRMLPFSRTEIMTRYGAAFLLSMLRYWAALSIGMAVLAWAQDTPLSLRLLVSSLLIQFPIFGMATLAMSFAGIRGEKIGITLAFVAAAFFADLLSVQSVVLGSVVAGPILIWISYRRWCDLEI